MSPLESELTVLQDEGLLELTRRRKDLVWDEVESTHEVFKAGETTMKTRAPSGITKTALLHLTPESIQCHSPLPPPGSVP